MDFALNDRRRRGATGARLLAAFGLRRFAAGYAGPLVRLRRASDNAERDFSAGAGMWLDEAAVLAWCGASSAYASVLYGQAGGLNLIQATASAQPRLVNAGVVEAMAGRPALRFSGAQWLAGPASSAGLTSLGLFCVARVDADAGNDCAIWGWAADTAPRLYAMRLFSTGNQAGGAGDVAFVTNFTASPVTRVTAQGPFANPEAGPQAWEFHLGAATRAIRRNGTVVVESGGINGPPSGAADTMLLGRPSTLSSSYFEGWIGDLLVLGNGGDADVAAQGAALRPGWGL